MHIDEFRLAQRSHLQHALSALLDGCRQKFLNAARLLELNTHTIEKLNDSVLRSASLWPLVKLYSVACERYAAEFFSSQLELLPKPDETQDIKWVRYFHHVLLTHLLLDDEFVRNVLRAMSLIPCNSPQQAAEALVQRLSEMTLPQTRPLWAPEHEFNL